MTEAAKLRSMLASLTVPSEPGLVFSAMDIPGLPDVRLGRSAGGPALLLALEGVDQQTSPIELKNLAVKPNVTCRTDTSGVVTEGPFTVCMCTTSDSRLHGVFIDALQCLLPPAQAGGPAQMRAAVEGLIELFSGLSRAPATSVLGLWGEVFLIFAAEDPDLVLDAWHQMPSDHYDFARGHERVEVKTTVGRRQHSFSLEQLTPPSGTDVAVASIVTESSAAGVTVPELVALAAGRCSATDAATRLLSGASKALGCQIEDWSETRYDLARAQDSLLILPGELIPRPMVDRPKIWDVRFRVDLEGLAPKPVPSGPLADALPV